MLKPGPEEDPAGWADDRASPRRLPPRRSGYKTPKESKKGRKVKAMSVASVTEISATSPEGFEEAINNAISRATQTLRNVEGAWVKDKNVLIENGRITGYKVNLLVTFVMEEAQGQTASGVGATDEHELRSETVLEPGVQPEGDDEDAVVPTTGQDPPVESDQDPPV